MVGDLGQGSGQFRPGWSGAYYYESEWKIGDSGGYLPFG
jgi:hypothetical protein